MNHFNLIDFQSYTYIISEFSLISGVYCVRMSACRFNADNQTSLSFIVFSYMFWDYMLSEVINGKDSLRFDRYDCE